MSMAEGRSPSDIRLTPERRIRGTPTGLTAKQPAKHVALRCTSTNKPSSKRQLTYSGPQSGKSSKIALIEWSLLEKRALVEFVLLHGDGVNWIFPVCGLVLQSLLKICVEPREQVSVEVYTYTHDM